MKVVVKAEVIKLLDIGIIYPISNSSWVSPLQIVPKNGGTTVTKKGGTTITKNDQDELIQTKKVTGWRVCIEDRQLNDATRKKPLSFTFY